VIHQGFYRGSEMKFTDLPSCKMKWVLDRLPDANSFNGDYCKVDIPDRHPVVASSSGCTAPTRQKVEVIEFRKRKLVDRYGIPFYDWVLV